MTEHTEIKAPSTIPGFVATGAGRLLPALLVSAALAFASAAAADSMMASEAKARDRLVFAEPAEGHQALVTFLQQLFGRQSLQAQCNANAHPISFHRRLNFATLGHRKLLVIEFSRFALAAERRHVMEGIILRYPDAVAPRLDCI